LVSRRSEQPNLVEKGCRAAAPRVPPPHILESRLRVRAPRIAASVPGHDARKLTPLASLQDVERHMLVGAAAEPLWRGSASVRKTDRMAGLLWTVGHKRSPLSDYWQAARLRATCEAFTRRLERVHPGSRRGRKCADSPSL